MATKDFGTEAARRPGATYLSPHKDFTGQLPERLTKQVADVAYKSSGLLYDGSDSMPGAVGAGTFWKDMTVLDQRPGVARPGTEEHRRQLADQLAECSSG